jgi:hypothetical protein
MPPPGRGRALVRLALLGLLALLAAPVPAASTQGDDPRGVELLRYDCSSSIGRRDLTLFGNGTLRLRESEPDQATRMRLAELGRVELAAYLARLGEEDLTEVDLRGPEASGDWVSTCELKLELEGQPERRLRFGDMDSLPLAVGRLLRVVDDLLLEVDRLAPRSQLPADYEPRAGDRLRRFDGSLYEVVAYTGDGAGLELEGIDEPLVVFISVAALRDEFEELVERRD